MKITFFLKIYQNQCFAHICISSVKGFYKNSLSGLTDIFNENMTQKYIEQKDKLKYNEKCQNIIKCGIKDRKF